MMIIGFLVVLLAGLLVISIAYNRGGESSQNFSAVSTQQGGRAGVYSSAKNLKPSVKNVPTSVNVGGEAFVDTSVKVR